MNDDCAFNVTRVLINEIMSLSLAQPLHTGGDILFRRFDHGTGVVHVTLRGACVSCASSTVTLRFMVLRLLQHYVEEVVEVEGHDDDGEDDDGDGDDRGWVG